MNQNIYKNKPDNYYNGLRKDLIKMVQGQKNLTVLEIGCANGITSRYLKETGIVREIYGIDLIEPENRSIFNGLVIGNIETIDLPFEPNFFDLIIAGDVLEHLVDPWKVVKNLKQFLKPDGIFIASIPNIRNFEILEKIIFSKDFKYVEAGILDRTHLRFFAKTISSIFFSPSTNC